MVYIVVCLLFCDIIYVLLSSQRNPQLYAMKNQMNYEVATEETVVAQNEEVSLEDITEFVTEEPSDVQVNERSTEVREQENANQYNDKKKQGKNKKKSDSTSAEEETDSGTKTDGGGDENAISTKQLISIQCNWVGSEKLLYGKPLDYSTLQISGTYDTGEIQQIAVENCTIEGFESKRLGKGECTIRYYGLSTTASYVIHNYILNIACKEWEKRESYRYGDEFSKTDLCVVANMADGTVEPISSEDVSVKGIHMKKIGVQNCSISYKEFVLSESYEVHNFPIELVSNLRKFVVRGKVLWDEIETDCQVQVNMADGSSCILNKGEYLVSGYSTKKSGKQSLVISYDEVSLVIPYQVYSDIVRIDLGTESGTKKDIYFSDTIKIKGIKDLDIPATYYSQELEAEVCLVGVYYDAEYTKPVKFPIEYEPVSEYQINRDGLQWHDYTLYAKYELVQ